MEFYVWLCPQCIRHVFSELVLCLFFGASLVVWRYSFIFELVWATIVQNWSCCWTSSCCLEVDLLLEAGLVV
jgi:hypothetical protein